MSVTFVFAASSSRASSYLVFVRGDDIRAVVRDKSASALKRWLTASRRIPWHTGVYCAAGKFCERFYVEE